MRATIDEPIPLVDEPLAGAPARWPSRPRLPPDIVGTNTWHDLLRAVSARQA
jgi:hypothetical protein